MLVSRRKAKIKDKIHLMNLSLKRRRLLKITTMKGLKRKGN